MKTIINKEKKFLVKDPTKDFHCQYGMIDVASLQKDKASTNKGKEFSVFDAPFIDGFTKIKRQAQIITPKDIGSIIAETGIGKNSKVLDAGSGSGALCCFLANICKKVISYEIRQDHLDVAKKNRQFLGLKNLKIKKGDVREKITEKGFDVIILDMPDPWKAFDNVAKALKKGGFLVLYSPTIPQVQDSVNIISEKEEFIFLKSFENIQRPWEVKGRKVRPQSSYINHTAFLTFIRRV